MNRSLCLAVVNLIFLGSVAACPLEGDANGEALKSLNRLKNRTLTPMNADVSATLSAILADGEDTARFSNDADAIITGYVVAVVPGGIESCNCHARDNAHRDTHIFVGPSPTSGKRECMIVEITPSGRDAQGTDWTTSNLAKTLTGHQVTFRGAIFFDFEHKQNSLNTNPHGTVIWRKTARELHPVKSITVNG